MAEIKNVTAPTLSLDAQTLAEMIKTAVATAVTEARKPTELELEELEARKELRDVEKRKVEADNQSRMETAHQQKKMMEDRRRAQRLCLHEGGRPVHSYAVFVNDPLGGYVLCQGCQATIRPEAHKAHFQSGNTTAIFDDVLFNQLFQKTSTSGMFA
jgi:hypothetical protein